MQEMTGWEEGGEWKPFLEIVISLIPFDSLRTVALAKWEKRWDLGIGNVAPG